MQFARSFLKVIIPALIFSSGLVFATTQNLEDNFKSIEYGTQFRASVKIVDKEPFLVEKLIHTFADESFSIQMFHERGLMLTEDQLNHMRERIKFTGGTEFFLKTNQDKIHIKETSESVMIKIEEGVFESQYNLSYLMFPPNTRIGCSTGIIVDTLSLGLPEEFQRRVFATCCHQFREKIGDELPENILNIRFVDVPEETPFNECHRPKYKRYEIQALFYTLENDVSFGILEQAVDESITPISLSSITDIQHLKQRAITKAGFGISNIFDKKSKVSKFYIEDQVRRAGHSILI